MGGDTDEAEAISPGGLSRRFMVDMSDGPASQFKDHFSGHADGYGAYRPTYPAALFEYLATMPRATTSPGTAPPATARRPSALAPYFRSRRRHRRQRASRSPRPAPHEKVRYVVAPAERTPLPDASVDLVTVAQALHWLDLDAFYAEVRRVARPGGVIAAWCYQLHTDQPGGRCRRPPPLLATSWVPYWPPERRLVEEGYRTLPFPFEEVAPAAVPDDPALGPGPPATATSARGRRCSDTGSGPGADPLDLIRDDLQAAWGDPAQQREVSWPLHLRVGRL